MSQNEMIVDYLSKGNSLTALEALNQFGCMRLAARCDELKKHGKPIRVEVIELDNGKHIARYWMDR